jgi:hypothetical protein
MNVLVDLDQITLIDPSLYICYDNFPGESDSYRQLNDVKPNSP